MRGYHLEREDVQAVMQYAVANRQIVIKKTTRPKYDLAELIKRIPKGYKASEIDWGRPVGREEW